MTEIEISEVKHLLNQTAIIDKKHKDIARITGADYNIFNVLRIHRKEVTLHSRMIKDLLNPKGKHAQGDIFLNLFLKMIKEKIKPLIRENEIIKNEKTQIEVKTNTKTNKEILDSITKDSIVYINDEESLGNIDYANQTGGSIDIFLRTNENTHLIIENKIDSNLIKNQLLRYSNSISNPIILFLDLLGTHNFNNFELILDKDFFYISYQKDILNWLEECKSEVSDLPHLRETLSQYINTIKRITNQNPNEMNKELAQLIFDNKKDKGKLNYEELINDLHNTLTSKEYYKLYDDEYGLKIYNLFTKFIAESDSKLTIRDNNLKDIAKYNISKTNIIIDCNKEEAKYFYPSFKFFTKIGYHNFRACIRAKDEKIALKYRQLIQSKNYLPNKYEKGLIIATKNISGSDEKYFFKMLENNSFEIVIKKELKKLINICSEIENEIENLN